MRIPARIVEHPLESLIAGALLVGVLLFGSADRHAVESAKPAAHTPMTVAGR